MKKLRMIALILSFAISAFAAAGCSQNNIEPSDDNNSNITDVIDKENPSDDTKNEETPSEGNGEENPAPEEEVLGFADVGERYSTVVKPLYDAAVTILNSILEKDRVLYKGGSAYPDAALNPRITSIRYFNGRPESLTICYQYDVYIGDSGIKSEYLKMEEGVYIKNFYDNSGTSSGIYKAYYDFLITERKYEKSEEYEKTVLPLAESVAKMFLDRYEEYKDKMEISFSNYGKQIILKENSPLGELHGKLIKKINDALLKIKDEYLPKGTVNYPLLTNQDIEISFGGTVQVCKYISVVVNFQNFRYNFYNIPFNRDNEFSIEYLSHMEGTLSPGYIFSDVNMYNPTNEEYADFFEKIDILNIELPSWGFIGTSENYFNTLCGENTFLYF